MLRRASAGFSDLPGCVAAAAEKYVFWTRGRSSIDLRPFLNRAFDSPENEIPAGHKITIGPIACAQGEGDNTACLDTRNGGHVFVISPERSWTF